MKFFYNFKSIKQKLLFGFSLVILLVFISGIYNYYATNKVIKEVYSIIDQDVPLLITDQQNAASLGNRIGLARGYMLSGDADFKERFQSYTEKSAHYTALGKAALVSHDFDSTMTDLTIDWQDRVVTDVFGVYDRGDEALAIKNLEKLSIEAREIMEKFEMFAEGGETAIAETGQEIIDNGQTTVIIEIAVTVLVIIFSVVIALVISNIISNPLKTVMQRMKLMAGGDLSQELLESRSQDEIGQLIIGMNEMNINIRALLNEINIVSGTVSGQSQELTQSADEVKAGSEQVAIIMEELATGSETQATHAASLSSMMESFTTKVGETSENGIHIEKASEEVLHMTNQGTELMESSTRQMAMIDGIVHEAVQKVEGLDKHSQEISELVSVIQGIADQTNLLALNAAIEAARAGEHGQGFAVVADEVRKLAEQSSLSVTDITGIVSNIQSESSAVAASLQDGYKEVEQGTSQIVTTGETFTRISNAVTEMVNRITLVSRNLTEINENSQVMGSSIQEIAAITEESAAGVEETSASSEESSSAMEEVAQNSNDLAQLAEELNQLVRAFKL